MNTSTRLLNMNRALIAMGALSISTTAPACCVTYADLIKTLATERAVIIYDQVAKVEHFVRASSFEGPAKDFGFILPTPARPTAIEVADEGIFSLLESLAPRVTTGTEAPATKAATGGVEVLETKVVGDFEVSVLKASDGKAIGEWLVKNGHKMRPVMEPWLDHYAKQSWILTAFKYQGGGKAATKAVRVSFPADRPHYPYKMPTDTWPETHHRRLDLFVISQTQVKGEYTSGRDWETPARWTAELGAYLNEPISNLLNAEGKDPVVLPANMVVTRFANVPAAIDYDHDLTFVPNVPPYWAMYLAFGALGLAAYSYVRRTRIVKEELAKEALGAHSK